ncbi:MAG: membrane protein insertase YidC, partial [Pseudomonadota bacterium]
MDDQNRNLLLATALSLLVIVVWFVLFPPPEPEPVADALGTTGSTVDPATGNVALAPERADDTVATTPDTETASDDTTPRVTLDNPMLEGSVSLRGGRIDDIRLKNYRETLDEGSPIVTLLSPIGSAHAYYALFGWAPGQGLNADSVPGANTIWSVDSSGDLTPDNPLVLSWDNSQGLVFRREMALDDKMMFTVTQTVENISEATVTLAPYGILARHGRPADLRNFFILHEGAISMIDGELIETDYDDFEPAGAHENIDVVEKGWTGFTDHYWMTVMIPGQAPGSTFSALQDVQRNIYQTTAKQSTQTLAPGQSVSLDTRLFAGAKEWETISHYQLEEDVYRLRDAIDWGWFFYLTKPIFILLHELNLLIGNMGWAIIALTLIIKAALLPLAYKSYVSMAKMKELQPEMQRIKDAAGDDRQKMQKEMMELYKKEKVNPASGCLPILL